MARPTQSRPSPRHAELFLPLALLLFAASACTAMVAGAPLSGRPPGSVAPTRLYLSTGTAPGTFETLGFVQVSGWGLTAAGYLDVGDANLDGTIHKALSEAALAMGGNGVIHIEFEDEDPPTPASSPGGAP